MHCNAWQNCIHVSLPSRNTSGNPGGFCSERPKEPSRQRSQRAPSQLDYSEKEKQILFHQWQIFEFVLCMNRNVRRNSRGGGNREDRKSKSVGGLLPAGSRWKFLAWHLRCIQLRTTRILLQSCDRGSSKLFFFKQTINNLSIASVC